MKIAWFGHKSRERGDGLVTYSREITEGLRARGREVVFFYHGSEEDVEDPDSIRIGSFNILSHAIISSPGAARLIEDTLSQEGVDVAHASLSFSLLDFSLPDLCHEMGIPIVATIHFPYDRRLTLWGGGSRALYLVYALPLAKYDAVIVFSQGQRALLAGYGVPEEIIHVIPNGVDVERYRPGASTYKEEIGAELLIVFCGRVDPEKNVGTLLRVFQDLELPPSHKVVVMGEGLERERLEDRYRADPRIIFTGYVSDEAERIRILQAADIFVLPSDIEGLSLSMLEAMACGLAVVATDVGSDGEALAGVGILLDPRELRSQLRLALQLLIEHPDFRRSLGTKARQRAVERYSLEGNIDRVVRLYEELLAGR
ncbi:MAG: glycosyltransferase family 4 protein [Anaerolineae bacterium]